MVVATEVEDRFDKQTMEHFLRTELDIARFGSRQEEVAQEVARLCDTLHEAGVCKPSDFLNITKEELVRVLEKDGFYEWYVGHTVCVWRGVHNEASRHASQPDVQYQSAHADHPHACVCEECLRDARLRRW